MAEIKNNYKTIEQLQTTVFALSADTINQSLAFSREMKLPFQLLCDTDKKVITKYHLLNQNEHGGIAYPAIFLIKPAGIIGYRSLDRTAQRVKFAGILHYLKELYQNPECLSKDQSEKETIIPSFSTLRQIGKNMLLRGNQSDWKHYIGLPFFFARTIFGGKKNRK